ncbi:hypothetical protein [Actinoalloteichus hymeniacidonis]|uniref:CDP-Glycerol:Poly(Glycerophosphate) glycerophosphotransferase n=1 Tax=Actinoalloteichus hymeniacidonis TaxID=340345 RepID=A0AAC9N194_9PSEU|nr:hypothetical protein [Actinoalloteichus hymeniacidonis]AOS65927.1 hypothetical protein TL08_25785 [Actinoalloteichus hymeniacidonis]
MTVGDREVYRAEPSRAEPSRAEPSRAEPSRAEPSRAEPSRAEPSRAEPSRAEPSRAWRTVDYRRRVLVVGRTVTTLTRLLDVLALLQEDHRIAVTFTFDASHTAILAAGLPEFLSSLEVTVLPWETAVRHRFDLALAASENDRLPELDAPIVLFPHGIGYQKFYPGSEIVAGMNPDRLLHGGRVVPAAIAVSHPDQRRQLAASCPPAAEKSVVVGDPCLDRLQAGTHLNRQYRRALGAQDTTLVVLASTWGPRSLLGSDPELPQRMVEALPVDEYRVAVVLHPGIWSAHGPWQVRAWLSRATEAGLVIIPPQEGWRGAVAAADCVVSDEGSLALYAAALDRPLLIAGEPSAATVPGSPLAGLIDDADRLHRTADLRDQLDASVRNHVSGRHRSTVAAAVAYRGESAGLIRELLYRLMNLPEPAQPAVFAPPPPPATTHRPVAVSVVGAQCTPEDVTIRRFAAGAAGFAPHRELDHRHVLADLDSASRAALESATILTTRLLPDERWRFPDISIEALYRWPHARLVAAGVGRRTCLVRFRDGFTATVSVERTRIDLDPLLLASLLYVRRRHTDVPSTGADRLRIGAHTVEVSVKAGEVD